MEKLIKPMQGFVALIIALIFLFIAAYLFFAIAQNSNSDGNGLITAAAVLLFFAAIFLFKGLNVINPNHSLVCVFFGKYAGTIKENGLLFVNPLYKTFRLSLRAQNLNGQQLKVNDKMGNPIEIAAVIVWYVHDTYKAGFEVADYVDYVRVQSEAAVRHLATTCPYDNMEDETATITLRGGGESVAHLLEAELNERLAPAGIVIKEARISHLAYAPEIAGAMLQRQQATAIVAARIKIVEGAVG
ncbi:MAG: SPFH domain-containing protein, partial [Chitinophagaceae bacterium]|nr:SPFH domain-containing protein [Chitinophagaceae bacterium]